MMSKYKLQKSEIRNNEKPSQIEPQHLPLSLDGPILVATTPIYGGPAMQQLEAELDKGLKEGYIRNNQEEKVLIISGTDGTQDGRSALTDINQANRKFYIDDCTKVGYSAKEEIKDIRAERRIKKSFPSSFINMEKFNKINFQILNVADYHQKEAKLRQDVRAFNPTVLCIAFCFSLYSDVTRVLRACGVSAKMAIEHDLRRITGKSDAKWNKEQEKGITETTEKENWNLFVSGSSGTGKTFMICQGLQILHSKLRECGSRVEIFITTFNWTDKQLIENFRNLYLSTIVAAAHEINFLSIDSLCGILNTKYDETAPRETLYAVISTLATRYKQSNSKVILLCDEIWPCSAREVPDWSSIPVFPDVYWLLAMRPTGRDGFDKPVEIINPSSENVISLQLLRNQRNSWAIKQFYHYFVKHYKVEGYISLTNDMAVGEKEMPEGPAPIWIQFSSSNDKIPILSHVEKMGEMMPYKRVTVIHEEADGDDRVANWCNDNREAPLGRGDRTWKYLKTLEINGSEDQVCVLLNCDLTPELITRARNLLVVVTFK